MIINGLEEDVKRQREAMEERRQQAKLNKVRRCSVMALLLLFSCSLSRLYSPFLLFLSLPPPPSPPPPPSLLFCSLCFLLLLLPFSLHSQRKRKTSPDEASTSSSSSSDPEKDSPPPEKKPKLPAKETLPSIGASTKTDLPNGAASNRPSGGKGGSNSKVGSKFISKPSSSRASNLGSGSLASTVAKKAGEVAKTYKTVAEDPSARQVYKSLFNSGAEKRSKEHTAHWVTYFPYH